MKLDFYKAFDSISWEFLLSVMIRRGFPPRYVGWIKKILTTSTSAISANGMLGNTFKHKRGFAINADKSAFIPFNTSSDQTSFVERLFGYERKAFPLIYLGLPLTIGKPTRACFQPLLDKIELKLAGWKGKLISRAGRLVLISSVISAIPSYFMSAFLLPSWLIHKIDQYRVRFLWGTNATGRQNIHLLAWNKRLQLTMLWNKNGSFFWKELRSLRYQFQLSTTSVVQNGIATSFWLDNWGGKPLVNLLSNRNGHIRPRISLKEALQELNDLLPLPRTEQDHYILSNIPSISPNARLSDSICWKLSTDGDFSVSAFYKTWATAGKVVSPFANIWKWKVPPSIKVFLSLLCADKLLTQQQLHRRNMFVTPRCVMCQSNLLEDAAHLFFNCTYATLTWAKLQAYSQLPNLPSGESLRHSMASTVQHVCRDKKLSTVTATFFWGLWLERNNRVFRGKNRSPDLLANWLMEEVLLYFEKLLVSLYVSVYFFEVMRVYIGSFNDKPVNELDVVPLGKGLFEREQDDLFADLKDIPKKVCDRRIQRKYHLPPSDFHVEHFREVLGGYSMDKFEKLKPKMIQAVDDMLGYDIPDLLKNFRNPYE
ncbi:hypothetical protein LUZ63_003370 [Rhynchospora breviuscula]|uniref:Reverse transcriptase domain-containing protein n=1 Tax=Rhynchospora breviuscula TaxID=2022672 RepID=A0A9Q0D0G0_9POAL|nr:hypothetical protein LUZ63_003370 [Rhynchospora breviuscula]